MIKKSLIILGITAAVLVVSACASQTLSQRNWGKSYETAAFNQTLNPDADQTLKSVDDLDPQAAQNSMQRYQETFKEKKEQKTVNLIIK